MSGENVLKKDELISKQQLEIEDLKAKICEMNISIDRVKNDLIFVQQWSIQCPDFPRVAMNHICSATRELEN